MRSWNKKETEMLLFDAAKHIYVYLLSKKEQDATTAEEFEQIAEEAVFLADYLVMEFERYIGIDEYLYP